MQAVARADVDAAQLARGVRAVRRARAARLVALWGSDDSDRGRGLRLCVALLDADGLHAARATARSGTIPSIRIIARRLSRREPHAARGLRSCWAYAPADSDDQRTWLRHASVARR